MKKFILLFSVVLFFASLAKAASPWVGNTSLRMEQG